MCHSYAAKLSVCSRSAGFLSTSNRTHMTSAIALSLTLQIDRLARSLYQAGMGGGIVTREGRPSTYDSIADAIRGEAAELLDGMCYFVEVRYCGLSSGSRPVGMLSQRAEEVATHLVGPVADFHLVDRSLSRDA